MMQFARKQLTTILFSLIFVACSSRVPQIIEKPVERVITIPAQQGDIPLVKDSSENIYYGELVDSLNNILAKVSLFFENDKPRATVVLPERIITVKDTLRDTVYLKETNLSPVIELLTPTEKIILFSLLGLFSGLVIWKRTKGIII